MFELTVPNLYILVGEICGFNHNSYYYHLNQYQEV